MDADRFGIGQWTAALTGTDLFVAEDAAEWGWSVDLDARRVRELFSTFSDWGDAEAQAAGRAAEDLGGCVVERWGTRLAVVRRVERGSPAAAPPTSARPRPRADDDSDVLSGPDRVDPLHESADVLRPSPENPVRALGAPVGRVRP